jgi:glycosyltransferase domain-containing protein
MNDLNKLTIIIPTFNRKEYVLRTMRYWSGKGPFVLVADGSEHPVDAKYLSTLCKNIKYIHFKSMDYQERMKECVKLVNTEYVMLHADDELFLPSGLIDCIRELENSDLICCLGRCISIDHKDNQVVAIPWTPLHTNFKNYALLDESPEERVIKHMFPYLCSTIYGVTKTEFWKKNWIFMGDCMNCTDEISYEIISAYQGKSKVIDSLSWIRSNENEPLYLKPDSKGSILPVLHEWWLDEKNEDEKERFCDKVANKLYAINPIKSIDDLKLLIYNALYVYSKSAELSFIIRDMANVLLGVNDSNLMSMAVNAQFKIGIFNELSLTGKTLTLVEIANKWRQMGIKSDSNDIQEIENTITDLYLQKHYLNKIQKRELFAE